MSKLISDGLRSANLFKTLPASAIETLAGQADWFECDADTIIFFQQDEADRVYLIQSGEVAIETVSSEGRVVALATLHSGDVLGEMAVLDGGVRSANARALTPTTLITIRRSVFLELISRHAAFALSIIHDLVSRLRVTDQQIEAITLLPLRCRLANLLLQLSLKTSIIRQTQSELAERLSVTREKVNINLQAMQASGAVRLGRGRVDVVDRKLLKQLAAEAG